MYTGTDRWGVDVLVVTVAVVRATVGHSINWVFVQILGPSWAPKNARGP